MIADKKTTQHAIEYDQSEGHIFWFCFMHIHKLQFVQNQFQSTQSMH